MSRYFDASDNTDHINCGIWNECDGSTSISAFCWFNLEGISFSDFRFFAKDEGGGEQDHTLMLSTFTPGSGGAPVIKLRVRLDIDGTTDTFLSDDIHPINWNEWHSTGFRWSNTDGIVHYYFDGIEDVSSGFNAGSGIVGSVTRELWLGAGTGNKDEIDGLLAEVCFWDEALTANEFAALHKGIRPNWIRPNNMIGYWPLWGISDPEPNLTGRGFDGAVSGADFDHHAPVSLFTRMKTGTFPLIEVAPPGPGPGPDLHLPFHMGPFERVLKVDSNGRLMVNSNPNAARFAYKMGPFNRLIFVDENGSLIVKGTN